MPKRSYHEHRDRLDLPPLPALSILEEEKIARARRLSPAFPSITEATLRVRHRREKAVARACILLTVFGVWFAVAGSLIGGAAIALAGGLGFAVTCVLSGQRSERDNGGH